MHGCRRGVSKRGRRKHSETMGRNRVRIAYATEDEILTLSEIGGLQRAAGRSEYLFRERTDLISDETRVVMPNRERHLTPN
ncbi:hypothetical protein ALC60_09518 [Trachymyrmex zeteki]|uniref:Uncharacterized protein n=1 Tax=Mycetomoellerius zeteki TaxID=64791 RepID=A0A151WU24_9HYME|nr:hypothetical protein ALC60_09518 [Trachymyrmex zeteki]